jgi:hypothetical protein
MVKAFAEINSIGKYGIAVVAGSDSPFRIAPVP